MRTGIAVLSGLPSRASEVTGCEVTGALVLLACFVAAFGLLDASPARAAFPGTNGRIAFLSTRDGGNPQVYTMNADGSNPVRLTFDPQGDDHPEFSPDGKKIVFESSRDGNEEIYIMNADGSGQTNLTNNPRSDTHPAFSPDGSKITFSSDRDGPPSPQGTSDEIYVMNADGSNPTRLTFNNVLDRVSSWSPDGKHIAFGEGSDLWIMNPDGSGKTRLTNGPGLNLRPNFSPDGTKIAFDSTRDTPPGPPPPGGFNFEIYVMNADGSGQTRLANNPAADFVGKFSPDGTKIAFMSNRDHPPAFQIYTMNPDGSGQTNISNNQANDATPDWGRLAVPNLAPGPGPVPTLTPGGTAPLATTAPAPSVTGYGMTNNPFVVEARRTPTTGFSAANRHNKKGTTFRYTLSEAAKARIVISQRRSGRRRGSRCLAPTRRRSKARSCTRILARGSLIRTSHAGINNVAFSGRIGSKALKPGHYQATLTATDEANSTSKPSTILFMVVRR